MITRKVEQKEKIYNPFDNSVDTLKLMSELETIDKKDIRTKFKATSDPIHLAFQTIENTPLKTLAKDFVKESFMDFAEFITSICK